MKMILVVVLLWVSPSLNAQSTSSSLSYRYHGNGYLFGAAGACQHGYGPFGGGGGAEGLVWKGLAVGVNAGVHTFTDGGSFGLVHPTVGWHFVNRNVRARNEFFVNFGPGAVFGDNGGVGPSGSRRPNPPTGHGAITGQVMLSLAPGRLTGGNCSTCRWLSGESLISSLPPRGLHWLEFPGEVLAGSDRGLRCETLSSTEGVVAS